jgi:hypothetical protein
MKIAHCKNLLLLITTALVLLLSTSCITGEERELAKLKDGIYRVSQTVIITDRTNNETWETDYCDIWYDRIVFITENGKKIFLSANWKMEQK